MSEGARGQRRTTETAELVITTLAVGPMGNDAYLLRARDGGAQLLVDAAAEPDVLLAAVREGSHRGARGLPGVLRSVVTTHSHHDHVGALAAVVAATGATTHAGAGDVDAIARGTGMPTDVVLRHGGTVRVGPVALAVVALRGHTPGSVALVHAPAEGPAHVFTGDSLFPGGVGNTDGDEQRFTSLLDDVEQRLFAVLDDDAVVHPGHGEPTTVGAERPHLARWRARGW